MNRKEYYQKKAEERKVYYQKKEKEKKLAYQKKRKKEITGNFLKSSLKMVKVLVLCFALVCFVRTLTRGSASLRFLDFFEYLFNTPSKFSSTLVLVRGFELGNNWATRSASILALLSSSVASVWELFARFVALCFG